MVPFPRRSRDTAMKTGDGAEMPVLPQGRYAPPAHMLRLTEQRETTPYKWVHPDKDR